jgi:hypothetical protein
MSDCAEQDGIEFSQLFEAALWQGLTGSFVTFAAEVEFGQVDFEVEFVGGGL